MNVHCNPLSFMGFLVEMQTTSNEKELLREIIKRLIAKDSKWLRDNFIQAGDKSGYWILNYVQGPRNDYNKLVRGMVVRKPDTGWNGDELELISSFPFTRFFNHGEQDAAPVNFANAHMLEKLDGTMVGVFFPIGDSDKPEFHTRKMASINEPDMNLKITSFHGKEARFMPTIKTYVDKLKFLPADSDYTFVFEFLHEISHVLTKYHPDQYGLYLLGARNVKNHKELTEDELNKIAKRIGSGRPRLYDSIADLKDIQQMFAQASKEVEDFEGYVFRDKATGHRVKVKDPKYVEKHHVIDNTSYKALIPLILKGEEDEVLAYFPHIKSRIEEIKKAYEKYSNKVFHKVIEWKAKNLSDRELSLALFGENPLPKWELRLKKLRGEDASKPKPVEPDKFIRTMILKYSSVDEKEIRAKIDSELKAIGIGVGTNLGNPKELIEIIGLHDEEDAPDIGEI